MQNAATTFKQTICKPLFLSLAAVFGVVIFVFNVLPQYFKPSILDQVIDANELVILSRNSPTTYYTGPDGPVGLEYDMAKLFADELGVELKVIAPDTLNEVLAGVENGVGQFAAAGLTITEERMEFFRFTPSYHTIKEELVYNSANKRPKSIDDVIGGTLEVVANSSHVNTLVELSEQYPDLDWIENKESESEDLLYDVANGVIEYTIADSNELLLKKRFLLNLKSAFSLGESRQLAWAFPKNGDNSLYNKATLFIQRIKQSGELTRIIERYEGHADNLNYVGTTVFKRHFAQRLPAYRDMFEQAASEYDLDWHLVAAIGYQESHWDPKAVSPTGVRGIMMLTQRTAADMGIENRLDPESSIRGGAKYFARNLKRIPQDIPEPDRTWMALAAYNVGFGHLEDARVITQQQGDDPHSWIDVRKWLPKLAQKKWYKKTRYGYARGWEPVKYVENIRAYYELLRWLDETATPRPAPEPDVFSILPQVP